MSGEAITATAEMPKNLATLTRALPQAATGLTLHYTAAKTNELAEYTVPEANITNDGSAFGTFSFTTSWGSENAAENLLWGQVAKEDNCTFYLTANNNEGAPMWATATAAHGSEIAFGQMSYRKARFMLDIQATNNLSEELEFTATLPLIPAAAEADITKCAWPTDGTEATTTTLTVGTSFHLAPQSVTQGKTILTIKESNLDKTWTLDLSTVNVKLDDEGNTAPLTKFEAGTALTLTVRLSLTQLNTPGSIEITDFTAATGFTSELGGTARQGYTVSADGKTYTVTNRYGLQAWLDAYAEDPTVKIVVDFPTEYVDLLLPEAFATDTNYPVSGNTWAGKTWKSVLYVNSDGNITLDAATTDTDLLKAAILTATNNGAPLTVTGTELAVDEEYGQSYFSQVSQFFVNSGEEFAGSIDLILPDLTELPVKAFYYSTFLQSISAPAATTIGSRAFDGCDAIETIDLPKATTIGELAFGSCTSLATVTLPKVTSIGTQAFYYCGSLTGMTFGSVVTSIGTTPFDNALTTRCTLTLNLGQADSTDYPATAGAYQTWAGTNWQEIKFTE